MVYVYIGVSRKILHSEVGGPMVIYSFFCLYLSVYVATFSNVSN